MLLTDKYADKIYGIIACYDRTIIQGYIPNWSHADAWARVQELRKNKRRPTRTGKTNMFSGIVRCADCGEKLYYCTSKNFEARQDHFVCSTSRLKGKEVCPTLCRFQKTNLILSYEYLTYSGFFLFPPPISFGQNASPQLMHT